MVIVYRCETLGWARNTIEMRVVGDGRLQWSVKEKTLRTDSQWTD